MSGKCWSCAKVVRRKAKHRGHTVTKDDICLLYEYDRWANARVLQATSTLGAEQFTRELGGSFGSVRDTLAHILAGEWGWLEYWKEKSRGANFVSELRARRDAIFRPDAFSSVAVLQAKWAEVEMELLEFLDSLTAESLEQLLPFRNTQVKLVHLMQHVVNHSTYHRGQVALRLRQLGATPLATDFHVFLLESRASESA